MAILYCFLNGEVQEVMKRQLNRFILNQDIHRTTETIEMRRRQINLAENNIQAGEIVPLRPVDADQQSQHIVQVELNQVSPNR